MSKDFWRTYYCVLLNLKQETNSSRHSNSISVGSRLKQSLIPVSILPVFCGCPQPAAHRRGVTAPAAMLVLCRTALDVSTSFQTLTPVFQCLHGAVRLRSRTPRARPLVSVRQPSKPATPLPFPPLWSSRPEKAMIYCFDLRSRYPYLSRNLVISLGSWLGDC